MSLMRKLVHLKNRQDGTVTITFGLSALVLFMAIGSAIDYGSWQAQRSQLQGVADAAALAAAQKLSNSSSTQVVATALQTFVNPNGAGLKGVKVKSVAVDTTAKTVTATVTMKAERSLSALMLPKDPLITVVSKVGYDFTPKGMAICLWALDPTMSSALAGSGGGTKVSAPGCTVRENSNSTSAVVYSGGASIASGENCFEGTVSQGASYITPTPKKCGALPDPFSTINFSSVVPTTCALKNSFSGSATLNPGLFCGGLTVSSGTFTFNPGVYVIKDGLFTASGGSTLRGNGVTFLLMGTNAGVSWSGGSGIYDFKAVAAGPLASFVVYLDPKATPAAKSVVSGGGGTKFEGIMYLPNQKLEMSGGSTATGFTVYIAKNFLFSGGSQFNVAVDRTLTSLPIPAAVAGGAGGAKVKLIN